MTSPQRVLVRALILGAFSACTSVTAPPAASLGGSAAAPALEDIFRIPGIHGREPSVRSLSADGRIALVEWRGIARGRDGAFELTENHGLPWLDVEHPWSKLDSSSSLRALLERLERARHERAEPTVVSDLTDWKAPQPGAQAWSRRGHRLALAWERALVVLDWPDAGATPLCSVLYRDGAEGSNDTAGAEEPPESATPTVPRRLGEVSVLEFSEDDRELLVRAQGELFSFPLGEPSTWPLALASASCLTRELAPKIGEVETNQDHSVFLGLGKQFGSLARTAEDGSTTQVTAHIWRARDGSKTHLEGFDELSSRENVDLSPDGRFVFAFEVDRTGQPEPTLVPDYLTQRVSTREARRELADALSPPRKPWIWSTTDGSRRALQWPGDDRGTVNVVGWAPRGPTRLLLRRTAADFRTVETWVWEESGPKLVLVERDERWVGGPGGGARWSKDGTRMLLASECVESCTTPDRCQLFAVRVETGELEQLTEVEGEVSSFSERDDGQIVFIASRADPARRELGVVRQQGMEWLDAPQGMNTDLLVGRAGPGIVFSHSELGVPAELYALDSEARLAARRVSWTTSSAYLEHTWIRPAKLRARAPDGTEVHSHVYLPRPTALETPDRARACIVFIHGAGYLQNVTDSMSEYAVNMLFHSRLAELGFVVVDVDYRGSAGYGKRFRTDVQYQLGKLELQDIAAVVDQLSLRGVIDPARVACYGGSYGGFLTLMALFTEPERWAAGAALRSVTDWRTYHPGYTQPRLGRPSEHEQDYRRCSPIDLADGLRDPLLILHGMLDTNVFVQDSVRLIEKLIDLGLDFEAMLYPSQGHGFSDGMHWLDEYRRIERFMLRHLGAP